MNSAQRPSQQKERAAHPQHESDPRHRGTGKKRPAAHTLDREFPRKTGLDLLQRGTKGEILPLLSLSCYDGGQHQKKCSCD